MGVVDRMYSGVFTAYHTTETTNAQTNITSQTKTATYVNMPCRLDVESNPSAVDSNGAPAVTQTITLMCASNLVIAPGSIITVTQEGRTATYVSSGYPAVYPSHQEITLVNSERWA